MNGKVLDRWDAAALIWLAAAAAFVQQIVGQLPARVPSHWNMHGEIDGWTSRDMLPPVVLGLPVFVWMMLAGVDAAQRKWPRKAQVTIGLSEMRFALVVGMSLLSLSIAMMPLLGPKILPKMLVAFGACVWFGAWRMGAQVKRALAGRPEAAHWKAGLFYCNREDSRLFAPKLGGYGLTVNFARPAAWLMVGAALLPAVGGLAAVFWQFR